MKTFLLTAVTILAVLLTSTTASAQLVSLGHASVEHQPPVDVDNTPGLRVGFTSARFGASIPVPVSDKTVLIPGLGYGITVAHVDPDTVDTPGAFHEIALNTGLLQRLPSDWALFANASLMLATNFEDVDGDHLRVGGALVATHQLDERVRLGFGLVANYSFGELLPLPALLLVWTPVDELSVDVFVPARVRVTYSFGERIEVGAGAWLDGNRFVVRNPDVPTRDNLAYSLAYVGALAGVRIASSLWAVATVGWTVFRRFELFDVDDDPLGDTDLAAGPVLRLSLQFRLPPGGRDRASEADPF